MAPEPSSVCVVGGTSKSDQLVWLILISLKDIVNVVQFYFVSIALLLSDFHSVPQINHSLTLTYTIGSV